MIIRSLDIYHIRNYDTLSFTPDHINILTGRNAQGKTTILEAIYMLATARSWKASRDMELIKWDEDNARVQANIQRETANDLDIEIQLYRAGKKVVKVNTIRRNRLSDLMGNVNAVLIEPQDIEIIRSDPSRRRKFMDLEISQIRPQYCNLLTAYKKILENRNSVLKNIQYGKPDMAMLDVLTEQLVVYAAAIMKQRLAYIQAIGTIAAEIHSMITEGAENLKVSYMPSFDIDNEMSEDDIRASMSEHIRVKHADEISRGLTLIGPQRDDILFTINDIDARIYASQGQQRTIALGLRLAEIDIMEQSAGEAPIALLDDVMTDLDEERRTNVFDMTAKRCQTFITAANAHLLDESFLSNGTIFLIEKGRILRI